MSNPKGINRRTDCHLCGAINRPRECEDIRCGWHELPPRKAKPFSGDQGAGGANNPAREIAA